MAIDFKVHFLNIEKIFSVQYVSPCYIRDTQICVKYVMGRKSLLEKLYFMEKIK